ncbi:uncharacterized protein LOC111081599 isoform X2 [Drosophila obscura]|nr:uncharacterized protein LOC111081599 isoform X2 [Drosophila obscura]
MVICMTLFGCHFLFLLNVETFLVAVLIASVLLVVLHLCGAYCPQVVLPNSLCTACVLLLCILTLIVHGILLLVLNDPIYGLVFCIVLFVLVLLMIPFNSQYINGRLKFPPIGEALVCSLSIYIHFIIMVISMCAFSYYYDFYNG